MSPVSDQLSRTAIHEAGHAVVFLERGHAVPFVTLHSGGGGRRQSWAQGNLAAEMHGRVSEADAAGVAAGCVAGEVAELLAFGNVDEDGPGSDHDNLLALLDRCPDARARKQILCDAYALAEKILAAQWKGVLAVAGALEERTTLGPAELRDVFGAAVGPPA